VRAVFRKRLRGQLRAIEGRRKRSEEPEPTMAERIEFRRTLAAHRREEFAPADDRQRKDGDAHAGLMCAVAVNASSAPLRRARWRAALHRLALPGQRWSQASIAPR
jgi:hypothetical protein